MLLGPGELLIRAPITSKPSIQFLRMPQHDLSIMTDVRKGQPGDSELLQDVQRAINEKASIRTFTFGSYKDLHAFERAVTGCEVLFDGPASLFSISRRRMVVSLQKKLEANAVRLQVLSHGSHVQVMASFEDFSHADAMIFQVKSSDAFEQVKGDKGSKYAVKLVEAKFSLPRDQSGGEDEGSHVRDAIDWPTRRRFVNPEGLDYAEESDDITIGFESEQGRSPLIRSESLANSWNQTTIASVKRCLLL